MADTLRMVTLQLSLSLLLLGLGFWLPVVGGIPVLAAAVYFAALDCVDPALGRRGWRLKQKLHFLSRHKAVLGGFGLAAYFLLTLPGINLVTLPVATIGGTLLILATLKNEV
ncbi:EI24 domain-containing protein [Leptolyngbya sp. FACHB-261]|nr:EI24 domain-containing protein [Leptolyngbya sp. FACHB-261]MBD2100924.1 EI24 domain-containing protein [Leptolyngbya sp. FACHB-261]